MEKAALPTPPAAPLDPAGTAPAGSAIADRAPADGARAHPGGPTSARPGPAGERAGTPPEPVQTKPTQQGTVYLWTLGVFSTFLLGFKANLAFLLGASALGCAGVAWVLARRNLRGLRFRREAPRRTRVGAPTRLRWWARNDAREDRIGIEIGDRPTRGAKPVRFVLEMPVVAAGETVTCEADVVFGRRGEVDLARHGLQVGSRYPLGLFRSAGTAATDGHILVRPREGRATLALRRRLRGRTAAEARRSMGQGRDVIYGIREYREGDDPRRIHWRTTARRGTLTVSEWRAEQGREAVIVLGRGLGAGGIAGTHFERAVSAAATIFRACVQDHLRVTLELGDGNTIRTDARGGGLDRGLDAQARVAAQGNRQPRKALRRLASRESKRTVVYVAAGRESGLTSDLAVAAGRGGSHLVIPAWQRRLDRWVGGLFA